LERLDDWVVSGVEVAGGVLVLGGIAAPDVPALKADAQVYPSIPYLQAIFAALRARGDFSYLVKVCAWCGHSVLLREA
jgi:hypothetical protein